MKTILMSTLWLVLTMVTTSWALSAPQLSVTTTGTTLTASWTAVPGVQGYHLVYAPYPYTGPESIESLNLGDVTNVSYILWDGAAYYLAIESYNAQEVSGYSNIEYFIMQSEAEPVDEDFPYLTVSKTVASMAETVVKVAGDENDLLTITIPKLPFGQAENLDVEFQLIYTGTDPLPQISINKDIEFDTAVTLEFRSDRLTEDSYVFVFHEETQDYLVPFEQNGNVYTAQLLHFSEYGFQQTPTVDSLTTDIEAGIHELNSYNGNGGLYALNKSLIQDLIAKIHALEKIEPALDHNYWTLIYAIIDRVVSDWLDMMQIKHVTFWDGYCVHPDFTEFITQLVQTMTEVELMGARDISHRVGPEIIYRMNGAETEWKNMAPPSPCDITNIKKYVNCGIKFATEMELSGTGDTEMTGKIVSTLDQYTDSVIANASCSDVACLEYYISIQSDLAVMGYEDRTTQLQAKLDEVLQKIEDGECVANNRWDFKVVYSGPSGGGTVTAKDVFIDFDVEADPSGTKVYAIADSSCAGALHGCGEFFIYNDNIVTPGSMWVNFNAMITLVETIEGDVTSTELVYGNNGLICDGHIPPGFDSGSDVTTWTYSNSGASCTFTLTPVK